MNYLFLTPVGIGNTSLFHVCWLADIYGFAITTNQSLRGIKFLVDSSVTWEAADTVSHLGNSSNQSSETDTSSTFSWFPSGVPEQSKCSEK